MWERLEFHNTPKLTAVGSNMAETELSVLAGQCLDRRIDEVAVWWHEVESWEKTRNANGRRRCGGHLPTADARLKLEKLYSGASEYTRTCIPGYRPQMNLSKIERTAVSYDV